MTARDRAAVHPADLVPLVLGAAALAAGTALGWDARLVEAAVAPPAIVRAVLVGAAVVAGGWLLAAGLRRIGAGTGPAGPAHDLPTMVRGIRLVFLAVAAFAAAGGWIAAHPLPLVIALVIAGVDVLETSFLLLVVRSRRRTATVDGPAYAPVVAAGPNAPGAPRASAGGSTAEDPGAASSRSR